VYLPGHRSITLEAGSAHPGGDGSRFLPLRQGTIELWFKPDWSTFDHPPGEVTLMRLVAGKDSGDLTYDLTEAAEDFSHSDVLSGTLETDGASRHLSLRCHRRTVFEGQRWVHLAWCWGQRDDLGLGPAGQKLLTSQLFIDGKQGQCTFDKIPGNLPASPLKALNFGNVLDGAIDELRISDTYRYTTDFAPPARDRPLTCDRHTRALFHFDGTLEGETADGGPRPRMIMNP
jgi:hypothetical protein